MDNFEEYTSFDPGGPKFTINGPTSWVGQQVTIGTTLAGSWSLERALVFCDQSFAPAPDGNVICEVYATDAEGKPTGTALVSLTIDAALFAGWSTFIFSTSVALKAGDMYVVLWRRTGSTGSLYIERDNTAPAYAGGSAVYSVDNGVTWTVNAGIDIPFKLQGTPYLLPFKPENPNPANALANVRLNLALFQWDSGS